MLHMETVSVVIPVFKSEETLREAAGEDGIYVRPISEGIQTGILGELAQPPEQQNINRLKSNSWRNSVRVLAACFIDGGL